MNLPLFLKDMEGTSKTIRPLAHKNIPPIKGLVLAGGKSKRMGYDKSIISYHGKPQREYMAELLSEFCTETYLSLRSENSKTNFPVIVDSFGEIGPLGGILSAFRKDSSAAWLAVASDIPLLDKETLSHLVKHRNASRAATCFHNPKTNFPEPLVTLWEPETYPLLLQFLAVGYSSPKKVLVNSNVEVLTLRRTEILNNANTPKEKEVILSKIKEQKM